MWREAIAASAILINLSPTMHACAEARTPDGKLIDLAGFIGKMEDKCELSTDLQTFRADLYGKYSFDLLANRTKTNVHIPANVTAAVGRASAVDRGSHTEITVPLHGLYHGLETRSLILTVGHGNGIAATMLVFRSDAAMVHKLLGDSVAKTKRYLENDPGGKQMILEIGLENIPEGTALICDESN